MIKFYVASGFQNKTAVKHLGQKLKKVGYIQTYDWTINAKAETVEELEKIGKEELRGVSDSDFLIVILPGGKGTHIELGIALSQNKRVYLYSQDPLYFEPNNSCTFYHLSNVNIITGNIENLISSLHKDINNKY